MDEFIGDNNLAKEKYIAKYHFFGAKLLTELKATLTL